MKRIKQFGQIKRLFEHHNGPIKTPFEAYSPIMMISRKCDLFLSYYWEIPDFRGNKNLYDDIYLQLSLRIHIK